MVSVHRLAATMAIAALTTTLHHASAADASGSSSNATEPTVGDDAFTWYKCTQFSTKELNGYSSSTSSPECAMMQAPLCYDGVCERKSDRQIDLFVKRYVSGGTTKGKPNIIFMQGGPGSASPVMETAMARISSLLGGKVNAYTVDHRGTGRSTRLDCTAAQAQTSGSPNGQYIALGEVAACAKELEAKYGGDLSPFSVTSAANDLKYFISNHLAGEETYVYGVSYGTLLVERLMHLNPEGVKGYILDGVATTSGAPLEDALYMSKWDENMNEVGKTFMDLCATNQEYCGQFFPNSLATATAAMFKKLDDPNSPWAKSIKERSEKANQQVDEGLTAGDWMRQLFGFFLTQSMLRPLIPIITYRFTRGDDYDLTIIGNVIDFFGKYLLTPREEDMTMDSHLLYGLIVYSELWESPSPTKEQLQARFRSASIASMGGGVERYCAFTKEANSDACKDLHAQYGSYNASPISYKKDKYFNVAASPPADVSVLMLSGKLDPQTPHKYAETLYKVLDTDNKKLVAFDYAPHGTLWTSVKSNTNSEDTCAMDILGSYISKKGDLGAMDTGCLSSQPRVNFFLDFGVERMVLGSQSDSYGPDTAYNSKARNSNYGTERSTKFRTALIFMSVAVAIAVFVLVEVVRKLRRARAVDTASTVSAQEGPYQEAVDVELQAQPQRTQ